MLDGSAKIQRRNRSANPAGMQIARRYKPGEAAISFSGAEDVVLIDMAHRAGIELDVFSLDTGRLHPETYEFLERVRKHYGIVIELVMPAAEGVAELVRAKGLFSFLRGWPWRVLRAAQGRAAAQASSSTLRAWITGQRKDQGVTRSDLPQEQEDRAFSTPGSPPGQVQSACRLDVRRKSGTTSASAACPTIPLHDRGFVSIGCQPCTRPVGPHQHERLGRWWWEDASRKRNAACTPRTPSRSSIETPVPMPEEAGDCPELGAPIRHRNYRADGVWKECQLDWLYITVLFIAI